MRTDLKSRLKRIRDAGERPAKLKNETPKEDFSVLDKNLWPCWEEAGFKVLKRKLLVELKSRVNETFPETLAVLVPDILRLGRLPTPDELIIFDLETTGLSGGAGTLAFLAAFGRFASPGSNGPARMEITQYLLLDYSGDPDFIERVIAEFNFEESPSSSSPVVVSYNGKSFDSQILKTRCLMNGLSPPVFSHADLLHPARRLWKQMLPDCSQAVIEVSVLGLDRTGDVSGAMAPEIWFSFLRSGDNSELLSVCDHNVSDITGLASLFLAFTEIAGNPLESGYRFDIGALALSWHKALKNNPRFFNDDSQNNYATTGKLLLETAVRNGSPQAAIVLAINAEWKLKDPALALTYTESALASAEISVKFREEIEKRRQRLINKLQFVGELAI